MFPAETQAKLQGLNQKDEFCVEITVCVYREMVRAEEGKDRTAGVGIKGQVAELGCQQGEGQVEWEVDWRGEIQRRPRPGSRWEREEGSGQNKAWGQAGQGRAGWLGLALCISACSAPTPLKLSKHRPGAPRGPPSSSPEKGWRPQRTLVCSLTAPGAPFPLRVC